MHPLVSVIIPNFNYARYLKTRIESVLNQTFQDFELILLDDASSDDSLAVIEQYRNHPKVSHIEINSSNTGRPFVQWEKGIGLAKGKYIWIAEADDLADNTFLSHTVYALEENPDATIAITMSHLIDSNGDQSPAKPYECFSDDNSVHIYDGDSYLATRMLFRNCCYNASMVLFRKDAYQQITDKAYLKMRYVGDWYFWAEIIHNHQIAEIRKKLNYFRLHSASTIQSGVKTKVQRLECTLSILKVLQLSKQIRPSLRRKAKRIAIYRVMRDYQAESPNMDSYKTILESLLNNLKISKSKYAFYWTYAHIIKLFLSSNPQNHVPHEISSYCIVNR